MKFGKQSVHVIAGGFHIRPNLCTTKREGVEALPYKIFVFFRNACLLLHFVFRLV